MRWIPGSLATPVRQPVGGSKVLPNSQFSRGLIDSFSPGLITNLSGCVKRATPVGEGVAATSSTSGGLLLPSAPRTTNAGTVIFICAPFSGSVAGYLWDGEGASNRDLFYQLGAGGNPSANSFGWYVNSTLIADNANQAIGSTFLNGRVCALRWSNGAQAAFRDGVLFQNWTRALSAGPARRLRLCSRFNSTDGLTDANAALVERHEWNYAMSDAEIARVSNEIWRLYQQQPKPFWAPEPVATVYRPGSDIIANGWTATPSGSLFERINEATLDTGDYITSPNLTNAVTLGWDVSVPTGTNTIRVNSKYLGTTGQLRVVMLDSGGSSVGNTAWQSLTATDTTYELTVTTTGISTQFRIEVQ